MNQIAGNTRETYQLEKGLERMLSPVTLIFPDRSKKSYRNGEALAAARFERSYTIKSIAAVDDEIGIILEEAED